MEQVPNTYQELFIAYGALWILICTYLWHLSRKVDALRGRDS